ncbi:hypothetical protein ISO63_05115 [Morganella morganii subsp. morganii]|uniref:hypothetical protein n=1 Tax=Morganella morganii TaxID=582 RepID=UPI001BDB00E2|nr:hypothetical protein [Morganella morganii]MBT0387719.1 hypothetical protein [Morganella morganii subsp. morganii]
MICQLCSKELADDETWLCDQCAGECPHLEVVEKIKGDGESGKAIAAKVPDMPGMVSPEIQ